MRSTAEFQLADRSGHALPSRYTSVMRDLNSSLWRDFPQVLDCADRDNVMEEVLQRVAEYERRHGQAKNLTALIRYVFRLVVQSLLRTNYYKLHQSSRNLNHDWALSTLQATSSRDVELRIELREFLESLDDRQRTILLRKYCGFTAEEIAAHLSISVANVYQILHRIRSYIQGMS